jgi:hypothetical protein
MRPRRAVMLACGLLVLGAGAVSEGRPRFYMEVRAVKEPPKTSPSLKERGKQVFLDELKKHPEVVTDLGDPPPTGAELAKALKTRRLTGYGLVLRITKVAHSLNPPAKGKVYKVLMVEVAVAIDAEKIPSGQMALAGEGNAQVGTEVSRVKEKERIQLTHEALTEAIRQAVGKSVAKLGGGGKKRGKRRPKRSR